MLDVIVPVYAGERETRDCLESIWAASCRTPFELVVVDDCSPEPGLVAWLDQLAAAGRIQLLRHAHNRGFVAAVNRGMALHPQRDVVLLNSDTAVANDWLDRLHACAYASESVATVTPFSNNATICSYPFEGWPGDLPGGLGLSALDSLFAETLAGLSLELPTAVGFCMFIRRASLDALGGFDEAAFGRGYGEENDFSRRAVKAGWHNRLAADLFVYHRGGVSFGTADAQRHKAAQVLLARHPEYDARVREFILADPLGAWRDALDRRRIASGTAEALCVLEERYRERAALRSALAAARRTPPPAAAAPPPEVAQRSMLGLARDWLQLGAARLRSSPRWGARRRALVAALLARLSAWAARWDR